MEKTKMSNFETEKELKSNEKQDIKSRTNKDISSCSLKIVIPRSMIIFISVVTIISIIALTFHAVPTMLKSELLYDYQGNSMRFDHRISSILKPSTNVETINFRGNSVSSYSKVNLESLRNGDSAYDRSFGSARKLLEVNLDSIGPNLLIQKNNTSPLSGSLTLKTSNFSSSSNILTSEIRETKSQLNSTYTCHKLVSIAKNDSFVHTSEPTQDIECKTHFVLVNPPPEKIKNLDLATINAFSHLSEASQSVKAIAKILDNKPENEGILILMASNMHYEPNWKLSLDKIYKNWEYNTYVSQIILTSWTISKSFFAGNHYTPALDFGFMVLNIPPEGGDEHASADLKVSLDVVKKFIFNLSIIIDGTISKILAGPNFGILSENRLTKDLFTNWSYSEDSFSFLGNYFNKNQSMLLESYLTSTALDVSRLIEELPLTIVDSVILAKDNLDNKYKENPAELRFTDPNATQVVIIPPVERKKIAKYDYEKKFRRICVYQAHTEQKSILRSTPSRASMAEYARYHGYSYFLFDGSFYDSVPRSLFTDWSKQGYYMKLFSGLKLLFWDLDKIGNILGKIIDNPKSNLISEKFYSNFLQSVIPNHLNIYWDNQHNGRVGSTGGINPRGSSGKEGIQITPSNVKADICDYAVWFDLDIAITNKFFSIERMLDSNTPHFYNKPLEIFRNIYKDVGDLSLFVARDSDWKSRNSLVNSGFLIISRSRYSLQSLFHSIALNPVSSQKIVRNGRFWPEQSTLTHAIVNIFNYTYSSPNQTYHFLDTPISTLHEIKKTLLGTVPILFTAYSNETNRFTHSLTTSQKDFNSFLHISPDEYGEGPWYPGDLFVHAAGQKSPFRDNVLSGMLYSINTVGFTPAELEYFKNNCYLSLNFVYQGLDRLIEGLTHEFVEFGNAKPNDSSDQLEGINNVDLTFHYIQKLMAVKTRTSAKDVSLYLKQADYEKIHFLRCKYSLPMATKWSVAEASALGGISILGITAIIIIFKFARAYSNKGIILQQNLVTEH